jgi:hypothetical protein
VGFFALRAIAAGEEITFDYKYERYSDEAAIPCYCGTPSCRGEIGGKREGSAPPPRAVAARRASEGASGAPAAPRGGRRDDALPAAAADALAAALGPDGLLLAQPEPVKRFLRALVLAGADAARRRVLAVLLAAPPAALALVVAYKGLFVLGHVLGDAPALAAPLLAALARLPIGSRTAVTAARLVEPVARLADTAAAGAPESGLGEEVAAAAQALTAAWRALPDGFTLRRDPTAGPGATTLLSSSSSTATPLAGPGAPGAAAAADSTAMEVAVPREHLAALRDARLDAIRAEFACTIEWTTQISTERAPRYLRVRGVVRARGRRRLVFFFFFF